MSVSHIGICCIALTILGAAIEPASAERWVESGPTDSRIWYDADNVRVTGNGLIGVWISKGPNRINPDTNGGAIYPTYSIVDCRDRTSGSKLAIDSGETAKSFPADSGMGELVAKLCMGTRKS
jgi:hypothetical protein